MSSINPTQILHAYRSLLRNGLHAVQYSKPSRYILRDTLNDAFRSTPESDFDLAKIANTVKFLETAALTNGTEHKVVKNLMRVRYWQRKLQPPSYLQYLPRC